MDDKVIDRIVRIVQSLALKIFILIVVSCTFFLFGYDYGSRGQGCFRLGFDYPSIPHEAVDHKEENSQ